MLRSLVQRVYWPLALAAALGLVLVVSSAEAANPGDPFRLGDFNVIDQTTTLAGRSKPTQLSVVNTERDAWALVAQDFGSGGVGVLGAGSAIGVSGQSVDVISRVHGDTAGIGVIGESLDGTGVLGQSGGTAVHGKSSLGTGVIGKHTDPGGGGVGVWGESASTANSIGVLGSVPSTAPGAQAEGVVGINRGTAFWGTGVLGRHDGSGWGVNGQAAQRGVGVIGHSLLGIGVAGWSPIGTAGYFDGNVTITRQLTVKGWKAFRIDDPLDPKRRYLLHAAVESNQVLNIYSGNITTDRRGMATVRLPAYFDRINTDVRYQLTVVGQFAQAIIAKKEKRNRFVIRTNKPHVEVSWQLTARRNDSYLRAHPFHDIQRKTKADKDLTARMAKPPPKTPLPAQR
jgi:hypothetical protein